MFDFVLFGVLLYLRHNGLFYQFELTHHLVLKYTSVVDNDTTVHGVHAYTVAFSPSVLIKCSSCPYHQSLRRAP